MSFRKRGEIVGDRTVPGRGPLSGPGPQQLRSGTSGPTPVRGLQMNSPMGGPGAGRVPLRGPINGRPGIGGPSLPGASISQNNMNSDGGEKQPLGSHPGVKPSILTSQPCISTGSTDLDKVLGHQGLPLGQSMLIEENGTTDFSSTLLKIFTAQGIVQNRLDPKSSNTHCIVVGLDQNWAKSLPGIYKGSSKERKKATVKENESKISVSNLLDQQAPQKQNDMKIAWRYGLQKQKTDDENSVTEETYPNYNNQFDITSTLVPSANANDLTCIPLSSPSFKPILKQIEAIICRFKDKAIRIVMPLFLNPMFYDSKLCSPSEAISFVHGLRALMKKYDDRAALVISLNLDLYPRANSMVTIIESLVDSVIELRPFDPALYELMEKIYKQEPAKIKHGHLNVISLPVLSDIGMMCIKDMEYSFKNGKKRFEVEEWSIPIDEEDNDDAQKSSQAHGIESPNPTAAPAKQTLQNLDF